MLQERKADYRIRKANESAQKEKKSIQLSDDNDNLTSISVFQLKVSIIKEIQPIGLYQIFRKTSTCIFGFVDWSISRWAIVEWFGHSRGSRHFYVWGNNTSSCLLAGCKWNNKRKFLWAQGQDTTSVAVSWCLYLIASNPDVQVGMIDWSLHQLKCNKWSKIKM